MGRSKVEKLFRSSLKKFSHELRKWEWVSRGGGMDEREQIWVAWAARLELLLIFAPSE